MEFCSRQLNQFCTDEGIVRYHTVHETPEQNVVTERMNITLLERARCMLSNTGLSKVFLDRSDQYCLLFDQSISLHIYWLQNSRSGLVTLLVMLI